MEAAWGWLAGGFPWSVSAGWAGRAARSLGGQPQASLHLRDQRAGLPALRCPSRCAGPGAVH